MISRPDIYLDKFIDAVNFQNKQERVKGSITVHVEAEHDVGETLARIGKAGFMAGLALNPATPYDTVEDYLVSIDLLLVMTVVPGFGGQSFMSETMSKIKNAVIFRKNNNLNFHIEVDGGINNETAIISKNAGANVLVAGTHIFKSSNRANTIKLLRNN